jgi:ABC-type sugar transport system substrate-binding protein
MYERMTDPAIKEVAGQITLQQVSGEGDPKKQIQEIDEAITKKPQVLMVSPIDKSVVPSLAKAKAAGIFVFQLDRCYVPWGNKNSPANSFYGADLAGVGSCGPFQYAHMMRLKGTGLIIPEKSSETGKELLFGMQFAFNKFKQTVTPVIGDDCGTDEGKAKAFVAAYLKSGKPVDVIFTENEATTLGAAEAVKEAGVKKYIFGIGGSSKRIFDAVKDGSVYAIFTIPPGAPGALEKVPIAMQHERVPKDAFQGFDMVQKQNVDTYLHNHPTLGD